MKYYFLIASTIITLLSNAQRFKNLLPVPKPGQLDKIATVRPRPGGITALSPAIDLSGMLPKPGMQGYTQGSCAAWSIAYGLMTYLEQRQQRWAVMNPNGRINFNHVYSPAFLYNAKTTDPKCKTGIYMNEALQYCIDAGALPLSSFPYDPNSCKRQASVNELRVARDVRLLSYNKIFDAFEPPYGRQIDIVSVKAKLNDSTVVPIGVHLDQSFIYEVYGNRTAGAPRPYIWNRFLNDAAIDTAYHAMLCVGYNDTLRAFKVMNSWDVTFGDGGFVWISEGVFKQVVKEAYSAVLQPAGSILAAMIAPEEINISENKLFDNLITDTNWIKKGYYREYKDLRVGCLDFDKISQQAIIRLTNVKDKVVITTALLKLEQPYQVFEYKGKEVSIRLLKIDAAGKNPFTKAVYYDLRYKSYGEEY
jgi:hypothetical protein